jgi:large subunit ribosomal protein L10
VLSRAKKEEQIAELKDVFGRASCVYVADYRGIDVQSVNQLRTRVHKEGGGEYQYRVTKNRVLKLAVEGSPAAGLTEQFTGPTAIAVSFGDPAGLAKILQEFSKDHEAFELKGGVVEGNEVTPAEIAKLATLPSLDALRGKLVGLLQAPGTKLARLLMEPGGQLARVASARGSQEG